MLCVAAAQTVAVYWGGFRRRWVSVCIPISRKNGDRDHTAYCELPEHGSQSTFLVFRGDPHQCLMDRYGTGLNWEPSEESH